MNKAEKFDESLQELARFAKVISHPASLQFLNTLLNQKHVFQVIFLIIYPLSRTTVSQHLKELRNAGLIHGEIDGLRINYCLNSDEIDKKY